MITRFFSTSKPIHLVLTTLFACILFFLVRKDLFIDNFSFLMLLKQTGFFLFFFASIALLTFMVNKNALTQKNSYAILFFVLLVAMIPSTLKYNNVLLANFFILLALRRIISLKSNLNIKKKLLDASIWIMVASLFYFWSFLFFALIFAALFLFAIQDIKNWFIPFIGILIVVVLILSYSILIQNTLEDFSWYIKPLDYDVSSYNNIQTIIAITLILSLGVWAIFFYIKSLKDKLKALRSAHILIMYSAIIAIIIIGIAPSKNGSEFLFLFVPLAIIMSNFIEGVAELWFGELFIWLLMATPLVYLAL